MKLVKINPEHRNGMRMSLRISSAGLARISSFAVTTLNLHEGQAVAFFQDKDKPTNWYLSFNDGLYTLKFRKGSKDNKAMTFGMARVAKLIANSLGRYGPEMMQMDLKIGEKVIFEEKEFWTLITAPWLQR